MDREEYPTAMVMGITPYLSPRNFVQEFSYQIHDFKTYVEKKSQQYSQPMTNSRPAYLTAKHLSLNREDSPHKSIFPQKCFVEIVNFRDCFCSY